MVDVVGQDVIHGVNREQEGQDVLGRQMTAHQSVYSSEAMIWLC